MHTCVLHRLAFTFRPGSVVCVIHSHRCGEEVFFLSPLFFNTKDMCCLSSGEQLSPLLAAGLRHCQLRQKSQLVCLCCQPPQMRCQACCWELQAKMRFSPLALAVRCPSFLFLLLLNPNFASNISVRSH